jgi:biopolymer transport protein ExbB
MFDACGSLSHPAQGEPVPVLGHWRAWIRLSVLALSVFLGMAADSRSYGQEDAEDQFGEFGEPPVEVDVPADNAGAAVPATPSAPTNGTVKKKTLLSWVYQSLGLGYLFIFLMLSVSLVSLFVMNMLAARRDTLCPQELVDAFEEKLNEKDFQGAYDMARTDESVLGQVLSAGLAKLSRGYNKALEGMQEVGEEESMKLEHRLSYMALIGNLSPMIGLFGTVHGMISSFQVIAISEATPKPADLAEGISTALFTTLIGLAIAIPAIAAYNLLRNRVSRLLLEVGVTSENLMSRFEDVQPQGAKK